VALLNLLSFLNVVFDLYVICDFDGVACRLNNLFMIMFRCSRLWAWFTCECVVNVADYLQFFLSFLFTLLVLAIS